MSDHGIELIIFDLGRVLVDFDFERVIAALKSYSPFSDSHIRQYFFATPLWDQFERGQIAPEAFFDTLVHDLKLKGLDFTSFALLWNDIFSEKHDTVEVLRQLRGRYRIAMLSNVNVMHWEFIRQRHEFMHWFDHPVASYAVGHRKPDPEAFHVVLKQAKVAPRHSIFIDDIQSHVDAAKSIGIRAYQFTNAQQLRTDLADLL